jgi:hypothetical protein
MPTDAEYADRISQYDRDDLLTLWEEIEQGDTPDWEAGKAFEYLVLRAFQLEGAEVRWPYSVHIGEELVEQIDGVVYTNGLACMVESKDYNKSINIEPIAKLRNQLSRRPATTIGVVFSHHGFTNSAITLASFVGPQTILLWPGPEIVFGLRNQYMCQGLIMKYRHFVEHGLPDFNITVGGLA